MYRRRGLVPVDGGALARRLLGDFDRFFEDAGLPLWRRRSTFNEVAWVPEIEVVERDHRLIVRADLPGLTKENVTVTATGEFLTIEGERKHEVQDKQNEWSHTERTYGAFTRTIPLPDGVKTSDVTATFENGVLQVTVPLPAAAAAPAPQKIAIEGGAETKAVKTAA
jgi:HSP20 family protein